MNHHSRLRPPRFGLKTLLWLVTALAICFASIGYLGSHATALLILFALAVLAHVVGNAMGTQLRDLGSQRAVDRADPTAGGGKFRPLTESDFAPATRLRDRVPLGRPLTIVTLLGTVCSGVGGGFLFMRLMRPPIQMTNVALGFIAAAVLGGIWTFAAASFLQVAAGAIWQARQDPKGK